MIAELFELPPCDAMLLPLSGCREELHRELCSALRACDEVPAWFLDNDRAKKMFRALADDGDTSWARAEMIEAFEMSAGFAKHFDRMTDHINTIGWAYWRLHRAERRAYGKEGAR